MQRKAVKQRKDLAFSEGTCLQKYHIYSCIKLNFLDEKVTTKLDGSNLQARWTRKFFSFLLRSEIAVYARYFGRICEDLACERISSWKNGKFCK